MLLGVAGSHFNKSTFCVWRVEFAACKWHLAARRLMRQSEADDGKRRDRRRGGALRTGVCNSVVTRLANSWARDEGEPRSVTSDYILGICSWACRV